LLPITNHQSPITNYQLPTMTNKQLLDHANGNGNGNGKHNGATTVKDFKPIYLPSPEPIVPKVVEFKPSEQPVLIGRPGWWSHAFVWVIVGITGSGIAWACLAPLEQAVPAMGKLEAVGAAREVRAPNGGVVREIFVKDGQKVKKGDLLLTFDPRAPQADLESLKKLRETLLKENQFYNDAKNGNMAGGTPEWRSLMESRNALLSENEYLRAQLSGGKTAGSGSGEFNANQQRLLVASRAEIQSRVAAARLQVQELGTQLGQVRGLLEASRKQLPMQQAQLETAKQRLLTARDQLTTAQAQLPRAVEQLETARAQLNRSVEQLETAKAQLPKALEQWEVAKAQLPRAAEQLLVARAQVPKAAERIETARQLLETDQALYNKIKPVVDAGALSELQAQRQQQQILTRRQEVAASEADILTRRNEVVARESEILRRRQEITAGESEILRRRQEITAGESEILRRRQEITAGESEILRRRQEITASYGEIANRQGEVAGREAELLKTQAEIDRLVKEEQRIQVAINRAQEQLQNTVALSARDILTKIADNQKRVAEIDSQLARIRLENQKKLDEISSQIVKAEQAVQYQELRAPEDGIVFDLKPNSPGHVVRAIDNEPVLKIVPNDKLVAAVHLQNKDIGHVQEGMDVDISVESFPATEFGTLNGKLISIGSDALPPTQERPFYAFPAKIEMERQTINVNGKEYNLQSGMAINATIKVRKRKVIDIFTELFQKSTDSLKTVR
jgi:HlyD family secretion protein